VVIGVAVSRGGFGPGRTAAFLTSIATTVLVWRIYLYRAGQLLPQAIAAAPEPVRLGIATSYAHLVMVAGVVVAAVGAELVIAHPVAHTRPAWVAVILGGPALFLAGRAQLEHAVFAHVCWDRPIGLLTLAALTPPMLLVPPLPTAVAATSVLAAVAAADAARARSHPPEPASPPRRT
jgi:low temperature requirement protein LtrA